MITKTQIINALTNECNIVKHLHSKVTDFDYKPGANMRTTLELCQYLTHCAIGPVKAFANDNWDIAKAHREDSLKLKASDIPAAMDKQAEELKSLINSLSDEQLRTKEIKFPWGGSDTLGMTLVSTALRHLTAYRMQLFVYAKAAGASELNTANCWMGKDMAMGK